MRNCSPRKLPKKPSVISVCHKRAHTFHISAPHHFYFSASQATRRLSYSHLSFEFITIRKCYSFRQKLHWNRAEKQLSCSVCGVWRGLPVAVVVFRAYMCKMKGNTNFPIEGLIKEIIFKQIQIWQGDSILDFKICAEDHRSPNPTGCIEELSYFAFTVFFWRRSDIKRLYALKFNQLS